MILPRPLHDNWNEVADFVMENFKSGESFMLSDAKRSLIFESVDRDKWIVPCRFRLNIGLMRFYTHVTKDIGLVTKEKSLIGTMTPEQWLFSGVDGVTNLDRLCKAMTLNGTIIPNMTTIKGREYAQILQESNIMINIPSGSVNAIEIIDNRLLIYGTWLDQLAENSGLIINRRDHD